VVSVVVTSPRAFFEVRGFGFGVSVCVAGGVAGGSCAASIKTSPTISENASIVSSNTEPDILLPMILSSRVPVPAQYCKLR
jgi:hypothetical protein